MDHQSDGKLKFKKKEITGQSEGVGRDFPDRPRDPGQVRTI
jgi:hypothetical protein